ncbi:uncharacterized protein B0H18DRAFT_1126252 [Fomitopsis serialis]|uniref:uncharacterized protein n=1 Tax=Fomitopsis serialis TaxID=139415 RepID=UPI002007D82D|nr:uncharacterized protein B0H18DRAFT_1126252 [Neoantrodia serialis]KAH9913443.1 hypothetical protein B0H18DRAFT_1126252 [Neoantrodia serialis]
MSPPDVFGSRLLRDIHLYNMPLAPALLQLSQKHWEPGRALLDRLPPVCNLQVRTLMRLSASPAPTNPFASLARPRPSASPARQRPSASPASANPFAFPARPFPARPRLSASSAPLHLSASAAHLRPFPSPVPLRALPSPARLRPFTSPARRPNPVTSPARRPNPVTSPARRANMFASPARPCLSASPGPTRPFTVPQAAHPCPSILPTHQSASPPRPRPLASPVCPRLSGLEVETEETSEEVGSEVETEEMSAEVETEEMSAPGHRMRTPETQDVIGLWCAMTGRERPGLDFSGADEDYADTELFDFIDDLVRP